MRSTFSSGQAGSFAYLRRFHIAEAVELIRRGSESSVDLSRGGYVDMRRGLVVGAGISERVLTRAATCLVICRQISIANILIGSLEAMIWTRAYSTTSNPRRLAAQGRARAMARAWGVTSSKQAVSHFHFRNLDLDLVLILPSPSS